MLGAEFTGAGAMVLMNINVIVANIVLRLFILFYRYFIITIDIWLFFIRLDKGTNICLIGPLQFSSPC